MFLTCQNLKNCDPLNLLYSKQCSRSIQRLCNHEHIKYKLEHRHLKSKFNMHSSYDPELRMTWLDSGKPRNIKSCNLGCCTIPRTYTNKMAVRQLFCLKHISSCYTFIDNNAKWRMYVVIVYYMTHYNTYVLWTFINDKIFPADDYWRQT